jgi:ABC-2 type transport system permease protein
MSVVQNAFANTSSSLIMSKIMGTIVDYLLPPLSPFEVIFAMVLGGITRGVMVGILTAVVLNLFVEMTIYNIWVMLFYLIASSTILALLGILTGIIADNYEQMSAVTSYIITPLSFLSGTFYSIKTLPDFFYGLSQLNPFFYMIDGFRYGMIGHHDGNIGIGMIVVTSFIIILWVLAYYMFSRGSRIKS